MADRRIVDDQRYAHFVTFSCDRRRRLLDLDQPKRIVLGVLDQEIKRSEAKCIGFVVMPEHVHAIVWFPQTGCLSGFMHEWKRHSSRLIREWYQAQQLRYFAKAEFGTRFWLPKYYSFEIETGHKPAEKLNYMHLNPVRAGLAKRAADWPWSSARWYLDRRSVGVDLQWID